MAWRKRTDPSQTFLLYVANATISPPAVPGYHQLLLGNQVDSLGSPLGNHLPIKFGKPWNNFGVVCDYSGDDAYRFGNIYILLVGHCIVYIVSMSSLQLSVAVSITSDSYHTRPPWHKLCCWLQNRSGSMDYGLGSLVIPSIHLILPLRYGRILVFLVISFLYSLMAFLLIPYHLPH